MSRLETDASPLLLRMIRGNELRLTPRVQRIISLWATNRALILDLAPIPYPTHDSPLEYFDYIYKNREPWSTAQIILARYDGQRIANTWHVGLAHDVVRTNDELFTRVGIPTQSPYQADGFLTTLQFGDLVIQILLYPESGRNPYLRGLHGEGKLRIPDFTLPIWPIRGRHKWPPKRAINDAMLSKLSEDPVTPKVDL